MSDPLDGEILPPDPQADVRNRLVIHLRNIGQQPGEDGRALRYDPSYVGVVLELAQTGRWPVEWAAHIGVTPQTLRNWAARYPEFHEAVTIGCIMVEAWHLADFRSNRLFPSYKAAAALTLLARKLPKGYGKEARSIYDELGLTGREEVTDPTSRARSLSREDLEAEAAKIMERMAHLEGRG